MNKSVIFLQKRSHRAGAQTCLARLMRQAALKPWNPLLVCGKRGWLTEDCITHKVAHLTCPFPSSRSLASRMFYNARFARQVEQALNQHEIKPLIVHANDHLEGLLGLALARRMQTHSAIFLRSPGMTRQDYFKYRCPEYGIIIAVGDDLHQRIRSWDPKRKILLIHDGIEADEWITPKLKPESFPTKILVIGSPLEWKGWKDLTEALYLAQRTTHLPELQFDFTGDYPEPSLNNLQLERIPEHKYNFLGRVEKFRELIRQYDLVINPTRQESFGMAAIEVLFAGVPLLSSRTGVIEQVQENPDWLFTPCQPESLAANLKKLAVNWAKLDTSVVRAQENIRNKFLVDYTAQKLSAAYDQLMVTGRV